MIEPMKQVSVICLASDRDATVDRLGELGTIHVTSVKPPQSSQVDELSRQLEDAEKSVLLLEATDVDDPTPPSDDLGDMKTVVERVLTLADQIDGEGEAQKELLQFREDLVPWGSFSKDLLVELRDKGIGIYLCSGPAKRLPEPPEGWTPHVLKSDGSQVFYVLVSDRETKLPEGCEHVPVPEMTEFDKIDEGLKDSSERQARFHRELAGLKPHEKRISGYIDELKTERAFAIARAGMGESSQLAYLNGYIPVKNVDTLLRAASERGWGVRLSDPARDDLAVPTLLRLPKALRMSKTIFDFIGILPGYREVDVSASVLVFLTLFFGMIIGDGGYGLVFLALSLFFRNRIETAAGRRALRLFMLLSVTTVVWGFLTGNFFAIPSQYLPGFMQGVAPLVEKTVENGRVVAVESNEKLVQWLCFLIAAVHLSLARVWNAVLAFLHEKRLAALGQVGWALFLWANFFTAVDLIVYKGSFPPFATWLYLVGAVLILGCGVNWREVGDIMNVPFNFINSFVDVLSYIRLFAVGLSSFYIAKSFNDMGMMVFDLSPVLVPATVVIILFGHLLNVALALMGVLVHGVRLNTLEFSNHMGLEWAGRPYEPLKKPSSSTLSTQSTSL